MTDKKIDYELNANDTGFRRVLKQGADQVDALTDKMSGIGGVMDKVNVAFAAMAAVLAGGAVFKAGIEETLKMTGESIKLAKALGTTTQETGALNIALGDIYSDADTFTSALGKLTKGVRTNEGALNDMGLKTRDAGGNLRDSQSLMLDALAVVNSYTEGTDRNAAAQAIFGKSAEEIVPLLKLNAEVMGDAAKKADELGLAVGPGLSGQVKAYKAAMNDVGDVLDGVQRAIGDSLMPVLTQMGVWFADTGPSMIAVLRPVMEGVASVLGSVASVAHTLLQTMAEVIGSIGGLITGPLQSEGVGGLQIFKNMFAVVGIAAELCKAVIVQTVEGIGAAIELVIVPLKTFAAISRAAFRLDWDGVKKAWDSGTAELAEIIERRSARILKNAEESTAKMQALALGQPVAPAQPPESSVVGGNTFKGKPGGDKPKTDAVKSRVSEWDAVLSAEKTAHAMLQNEQGTFHAFSQARETEYWRGIMARTDLSKEERLAVEKKFLSENDKLRRSALGEESARIKADLEQYRTNLDQRLVIAKAAQDRARALYGEDAREYQEAAQEVARIERDKQQQLSQLQQISREAKQQAALDGVSYDENMAQLALQRGVLTQNEMLALQVQFEQRRFEIAMASQQERLQLLDAEKDRNVVAIAQTQAEIEALQRQHAQRMGQLAVQQNAETQGPLRNSIQSLASQWQGGLEQMLQGQLKWRNALTGMWAGIKAQFFKMTAEMGLKWIATEALKTLATSSGVGARIAALLGGKAIETSTTVATAGVVVGAEAVKAGAGAAASQAAIPIIGPGLALAAMAATLGAVLGLTGSIPSARSGFDIPAGMNPLTQLHEQEMVLPQPQADVIREMAANGGVGGGGTFHVHAMDAASVRRLLMDHAPAVAGAIKHHVRNGGR